MQARKFAYFPVRVKRDDVISSCFVQFSLMLSVFTACLEWIRKQSHFTADQLRNPWQMLVEPLGSVEPRLKITEPQAPAGLTPPDQMLLLFIQLGK